MVLKNTGNDTIKISTVSSLDLPFKLIGTIPDIAPGDSVYATIELSQKIVADNYTDTLFIISNSVLKSMDTIIVSATIKQLPMIIAESGDVSVCAEQTVSISVKTTEEVAKLQWEATLNSGNTWKKLDATKDTIFLSQIKPEDAGVYRCIASNDFGGRDTSAEITVTVLSLPRISFPESMPTEICWSADAFSVEPTVSNDVEGLGEFLKGATDNQFDPSIAKVGKNTLTYYYKTTEGCSDIVSATITVAKPDAPEVKDKTLLVGEAITAFTADNSGTITWMDSTGSAVGTESSFLPDVQNTIAKHYKFNALFTDSKKCSSDTSTFFLIFTDCSVQAPQEVGDTVCTGATGTLKVSGEENSVFTWYESQVSKKALHTGNQLQTDSVATYYVSQLNGCESPRTKITLRNYKKTKISAISYNKLYNNAIDQSYKLESQPLGVFEGQDISSGMFNPYGLSVGSYQMTLTVTDANNCKTDLTFSISVDTVRVAIASVQPRYCADNDIDTLFISPENTGIKGIFSGRGILSSADTQAIYSPKRAGFGQDTIVFTYSDRGATFTDTQIVDIMFPLTVDLGEPILATAGTAVTIDAGEGYKHYIWNNGSTTRSINAETAGVYRVSVSS